MAAPEFGEHIAIVEPDVRGRFQMKRFITREPVTGWRVFRSADGREIKLEAIVSE